MAHKFPEITAYDSALRFALEAEQACADFAAAAGVVAPDQAWQDKLEEVVCTHDDRVRKLSLQEQSSDTAAGPAESLTGGPYLGVLDSEPETSWPAVAEQLIQAEEDAARYHEEFVMQCADALGPRARLFGKSAQQNRTYAAELRELLG